MCTCCQLRVQQQVPMGTNLNTGGTRMLQGQQHNTNNSSFERTGLFIYTVEQPCCPLGKL